MPHTFKEWLTLIGSLILTEASGIIGALFTSMSVMTWYTFLDKPEFAPPNWVFGPVWVTLYALLGYAFFLVLRKGFWLRDVRAGTRVFLVALVLNVLWSVAFFGFQNPLYGLCVLGGILLFSYVSAYFFYRVSKWAGLLLVPYLLWITFAFILNYTIWILN